MKEWENRMMPKQVRNPRWFASILEKNGKISKELETRINRSDNDRRDIIHALESNDPGAETPAPGRNMFHVKEVTKQNILELMDMLLELDNLSSEHKRTNADKLKVEK